MFYCRPCAFDLGWPWSGHFTSYGRCETCYAYTECVDISSSLLPSKRWEQAAGMKAVKERRVRNRSTYVIQEEP